jgi:DNA replication and repair protein RecF
MYLQNLTLQNFRNFSQLKIEFDPHVNIFIGKNAQGKTNLLEAIYCLALTRSQRTNNEKELIRLGSDFAILSGQAKRRHQDVVLRLTLSKQGKRAWVNQVLQPKLSKYVGQLNAVLFSPEDLALVKGAPSIRRRFLDVEFGQANPEYLYFSSKYRQVLQQRNNYLKQLQAGRSNDQLFLDVLSDQLAGQAAEVISRRLQLLQFLTEAASTAYRAISAASEELTVKYVPSVAGISKEADTDRIYEQLRQAYAKNRPQELRLGTTLVGPHRDDLHFLLDGKDARQFASQGQQRTIALSMKLAEIDLMQKVTGEFPLLLLDDVMSELDQKRQGDLLNYIHGKTQTFITTTDLSGISWEIMKQPQIFHLSAGQVSKEG